MPVKSFELSLAAVDIMSQTLNVNARQFPFQIPSVGQYQVDRIRLAKVVFADLARRGLIRHGEVDADLRKALRVLSNWVVAVAVMGTVDNDRTIYARASAAGEIGVLAVLDGQRMRLELIRPTALAMTMVGLLPKAGAGPGQSVTITRPAPAKPPTPDDEPLFRPVQPPGGSNHALRIVQSFLDRPRTGAGFFVVSGRDRNGREVRGGELGWFDTDAGRYLSLARPPGEDGQLRGTYSPADSARLTQQLGAMIEAVAPAR